MAVTRSYSIPEEVAVFIDTLPLRERSKFVSSTLKKAVAEQARQRALNALDAIVPIKPDDKKSSVDLLAQARHERKKSVA